jgi:DNA-binding NtrC family response regulator
MNILVVDDNTSLARALKIFLEQEGHDCTIAETVKQGLSFLDHESYDLIITDLKLPDGKGLEIIARARQTDSRPLPEVILMTAFGTVESAVEAMKLGAMDYLTKPVSLEEFAFRVQKVENLRRLELKNERLMQQQQELLQAAGLNGKLDEIAGKSAAITEIKKLIVRVAPYPSTVLITGETGVGKEMVARAVHNLSDRSENAFVRVNCASIPDTLFESELFGHEKGAFTDAKALRRGCFEAADGGTVFLDEVGEIPVNLQAKLLRVLQEKEIVRLGSSKPIKINVRIVAATNRNLEEMVKDGGFREDLLYRLGVFRIHIPSLRERAEDIEDICSALVSRLGSELKKPALRVSKAAAERLKMLAWPGNIRELRNSLERAAVMSDTDVLEPVHFDLAAKVSSADAVCGDEEGIATDSGLIGALENLEFKMIKAALEKNNQVKSRAAEELKIPRTQLLYRMKRLGMSDE